ncbi:MAG: hypothetical protein LBE34_14100 [Flavobacteriaceae bacterium]|jgi:hypothetical protein|nr:hypothetical protein [Flavobacteriaceae bacterium]
MKKEKHLYINLEIGEIEQYSKIVPLSEVVRQQEKGWLTYEEIGLEKGDKEAYMLYGELNKSIETLMFNCPKRLEDTYLEALLGRKITGFSIHLGTYGMGGAGFFGLLLDDEEYLVLAQWNSSSNVFVDDRPVCSSPKKYEIQRPWVSNFGGELTWDELSDVLIGTVIEKLIIDNKTLSIVAISEEKRFSIQYRLVFEKGKEREVESLQKMIVFQDKDAVLIV